MLAGRISKRKTMVSNPIETGSLVKKPIATDDCAHGIWYKVRVGFGLLELMNSLRRTLQERRAVDCSLDCTIFWSMLCHAAEGDENYFCNFHPTVRTSLAIREVPKACRAGTYSAKNLGVKLWERANRIRSLIPEGAETHFLISSFR